MITQLDTENADRDISALVTVLTDTPHASNPMLCQGLIFLGDGAKNLDGTGGDFSLVITVGGQTIEPSPQTVTFSTAVRAAVWTTVFPVPANKEVIMRVLSPNAADSDVDVTAYLYDVGVSAPSVNAEVLDVLTVDTSTLPGQAAPPLAPTMEQAITYLYKFLRNRIKTDATSIKVYADNETTVDHKATISDDDTDFIREEFVSGP